MRRFIFCISTMLACFLTASCVKEDAERTDGTKIGATVTCEGNKRTKTDGTLDVLNQVIVLDDDYSIEEVISDGMDSPAFVAEIDTRGTVTTTNNIGKNTHIPGQYFGMMGFIENPEDMDAIYSSTPNPYVSYGVGFRVAGDNKLWKIVNPATTDKEQYPWLWNLTYDFWAFAPVNSGDGHLMWGPYDVQEKNEVETSFSKTSGSAYDRMEIKDYVVFRGNETDRVSPGNTYNDTHYQTDLIVAYKSRDFDDDNKSANVNFTFKHALAAVRFNVSGVTNLTVKNVCMKNVMGNGSCVVTPVDNSGNLEFEWTTSGFPATFWQTYTSDDFHEEMMGTVVDMNGDKIFFMIPQELTDARLGVTFQSGDGSIRYIEKDINTTWEAGKTYTYNIIFSGNDDWEYFLEPIPDVFTTYEGGSGIANVYSYRVGKSEENTGRVEAVPWKLQYNNGAGSWTDAYVSSQPQINNMVAVDRISGTGGIPGSSVDVINISVGPQASHHVAEDDVAQMHARILKSRQAKINYDLSFYNPATGQEMPLRNTANCYVVSAPGTYKFPLVYGNGIKNGSVNYSALSPDKTTVYDVMNPIARKTFVGHDDMPITDPYIWNSLPQKAEPFQTYVLWEDSPGLIQNVSHTDNTKADSPQSGDQYFVTFEVPKETIHQGNCVIAIQQGDILWSWHIWVTDEDLSDTISLYDDSTEYAFMPFNLGWCSIGSSASNQYDDRAVKFRVVASMGNNEQEFLVEELGYLTLGTSTRGYNPFYQWGRKDPIIPGTGENGNNHTIYNSAGVIDGASFAATYLTCQPEPATIGKSIREPMKLFGIGSGYGDWTTNDNQDDWCEGHYYNYSQYGLTTRREFWNKTELRMDEVFLHGCGFANLWSAYCTKLEIPQYPIHGGKKTTDPESLAAYSIPVTKTIYDPSPVGFSIPDAYAFIELLSGTTFNKTTLGGEKNVNGKVFFMPATGYRGYDVGKAGGSYNKGSIIYFGTDANIWTSTSNTRQRASYTSIGTGEGLTMASYDISVFFKAVGACVRPVKQNDIIDFGSSVIPWQNGGGASLTLESNN